MKSKFIEAVENTSWYRQLVYGLILALFFGATTILSGFNPVWAIAQICLIAGVKEHYMQDLQGEFNWRNFLLLIVPVLLLYIFITL